MSNGFHARHNSGFRRTYDRARHWTPSRADPRDHRLACRFFETVFSEAVVGVRRDRRSLLRLSVDFVDSSSIEPGHIIRELVGHFEREDEGAWLVREGSGTDRWNGIAITRRPLASVASMVESAPGVNSDAALLPGVEGPWASTNRILVQRAAAWIRFCVAERSSEWQALDERIRSGGSLGALWASTVRGWVNPHTGPGTARRPHPIATKPYACPVCRKPVHGRRRDRVYCGASCRQRAYVARRSRRAETRLYRLAHLLEDTTYLAPLNSADRIRVEALAEFLEDADLPCALDVVAEDRDPHVIDWEFSVDIATAERFQERAAIVEEACGVDRRRAEWMAFAELAGR